ncbi:MAG: CheR family methyltransferase [Gammaproteobacteria bacterium]|nr:CheR family methyltransferase [Gammaproteobacteria bacterium]
MEQTEPHYTNLPINVFFRSLAMYKGGSAAAIILSGTGTDGSIGARDIKLNRGMVIAQEPASAKFDQMPVSAINTGVVDFVLPPEEMSRQLTRWLKKIDMDDSKNSSELQHIFMIVRAKTGYDFSCYKLNTIHRRIEKQMYIHHLTSMSDYVKVLRDSPQEVNILFKSFLIGVTRFFRDSEAFDVFKQTALPEIFNKKPPDYCIRVWVPGCSTGEEVYSIAIAINEYMEETQNHCCVQIFGTDIDRDALSVARSGIYSDIIEHDVSSGRLKRYFTKEKNKYKINKEIRSMVVFGEQNLIKDPPFTKVDIISCRNLLIYLNIALQKKILPIFHYSLKPQGVLFLGMSESVAGYSDLFELISKKAKLFERKNTISQKQAIKNFPDLSQHHESTLSDSDKVNINSAKPENNFMLKKYLLNKFVPPCMLVNKQGDILYIHEKLKKYINVPSVLDDLNITDVMHHNIKNILKSAIMAASSKKKEMTYHDLVIKHHNHIYTINLKVLFVNEPGSLHNMLLVIFEEESIQDAKIIRKTVKEIPANKKDKIILELKTNLRHTTENLQATVEELESSNEELQSMNEELQSTNEEIETSKEELNSLNEELVIMNTELQSRIDKLATVHDDMSNLYNSTEVATFFLDNNLCIKGFTPKAQEFIHLIPADIGRSIAHFATTIKYEKLIDDAEEVLRTLNQKTVEVQSKTDRWFLVRILPYRTLSNMIDGVVVTLTDITEHKETEKKLSHLNKILENALTCWKNILDALMVPSLVLTVDLKIVSANRAFYKNFHLLPEDVIDKKIYDVKEFSIPMIRDTLEKIYPEGNLFEGFEIETDYPGDSYQKIIINARKIYNAEFGDDMILLAMELK